MKRKLIWIVALCVATIASAKDVKEPNSYNYQRGVECVQNEDYDEAYKFLGREIDQNPKNGYAYAWMGAAYGNQEEWGNALHFLKQAIKYLPKQDKHYQAWAHNRMGAIYLEQGDTIAALREISQSIKIDPKNPDWYRRRAMIYRDLKDWEHSDADLHKMIGLAQGIIRGNLLLGRNLYLQERYEEALEEYKKAHFYAERSYTYSAMAEAELKLGLYEDAAEHLVEALKIEPFEDTFFDLLEELRGNKEFADALLTRLKLQQRINSQVEEWPVYISLAYASLHQYEDALAAANDAAKISADILIEMLIAKTYQSLGDNSEALLHCDNALAMDSTETYIFQGKADCLFELQRDEEALALYEHCITLEPEEAEYYHSKGQYFFFLQQYETAIEDFTTVVMLDKTDRYARYLRGRCYLQLGDTVNAQKDFLRVEKEAETPTTRAFAKVFLRKPQEAIAIADSLCAVDTIKYEHRYNTACIYALVGDTAKAWRLLRNELEDDFVDFRHLRLDPDLAILHGEEFDSLVNYYETLCQERVAKLHNDSANAEGEERVVEVPFTATNGVTKVNCSVNGLALSFIFDTGASDVSISQVEADFMLKNGYLSQRDITGSQRYQTADGHISVGTTINLRHINFGGLELTDVKASVVQSQQAPLLLGQSILQRLGRIEIDNEKRILKITTTH